MKYRKLSSTGDYVFGNGNMDFYTNSPEAVGQSVVTRLKLWVNEWFLNVEEGTLWLQGVIGKQQQSTVDTILRSRILETQGVTDITSYDSIIDPDTRKLSLNVTIDTLYGSTTIQAAI
jgi:hypothetical protein